jgi:hypothetical protein
MHEETWVQLEDSRLHLEQEPTGFGEGADQAVDDESHREEAS